MIIIEQADRNVSRSFTRFRDFVWWRIKRVFFRYKVGLCGEHGLLGVFLRYHFRYLFTRIRYFFRRSIFFMLTHNLKFIPHTNIRECRLRFGYLPGKFLARCRLRIRRLPFLRTTLQFREGLPCFPQFLLLV